MKKTYRKKSKHLHEEQTQAYRIGCEINIREAGEDGIYCYSGKENGYVEVEIVAFVINISVKLPVPPDRLE